MTKEQIVSGAIVTLIATLVGWLTNRASNKASVTNVTTSSRVEMEKEAYERARKLDTETITRQDAELKELETKYDRLKSRYDTLDENNQRLNDDVARMTHDNYQLHRENTRILELNEQIIHENKLLRTQGENLMLEVGHLRVRVTKMQRGEDSSSPEPIRQRQTDTDPIMPEVTSGRE